MTKTVKPSARDDLTGLILTGGRGTRMGGADKGLLEWRGRPLVEHVLERLAPQTGPLLINANRNRARYATYGHPVLADPWPDHRGPLAGVLAGLEACRTDWLLCVPCDAPRLPLDLGARLIRALPGGGRACLADDGHPQPVFALLHRSLAAPLRDHLEGDDRAVIGWLKAQGAAFADCRAVAPGFANFNHPDDLT